MGEKDVVHQVIDTMVMTKKIHQNHTSFYGLSRGELGLLVSVVEHEKREADAGITVTELSQHFEISRPAISQIVGALE